MYVQLKRRRCGKCVLCCCYLVIARRQGAKVRHDVVAYLAGVSEIAVAQLESASGNERTEAAEQVFRFWKRLERNYSDRLFGRVPITWDDLRRQIEGKIQFIDSRAVRIIRRIAERQAD
jgi:hypothetical protein